MNRFAFACALLCSMFWFASSEAVGPGGQEKISEPAKQAVKQDKKEVVDEKDKAAGEKKAVGVKTGVSATKVMAVPAKAAQKEKEVKAKAAVRRVAAPVAVAPMVFNANLAAQQFLPQFQKLHKAELHFMRMVCQPNRQQFEAIARDGEKALKDLAEQFARNNQNNGFIIVNAGMADGVEDKNDFHRQISDAVAKSARKVLTAEQANRFDRELAERREANKQTVVLGFVAKMDRLLHLTAEQREKLIKVLNAKWKYSANREQLLNLNLGGGQYFPLMPDAEINPILTEAQRHVWSGVQKGNMNFGVSVNDEGEEDFEEKWDEPARKPAPADTKSKEKPSGSDKKGKS